MKIRKKSLLIILGLLGLSAALYVTSSYFLLGGFLHTEADYAQINVERALNALNADVDKLDYITRDWAWWDETYAFVKDRNQKYAQSNLNETSIGGIKVDLLLYADTRDHLIFATGFDQKLGKRTPFPGNLKQYLFRNRRFLDHTDLQDVDKGLLLLPEGPLLIASRPILTGEGKGPIRGTLLMGRYLNETEQKSLAQLAQLTLHIYTLNKPSLPSDVLKARALLLGRTKIYTRPLDSKIVAGYALVNDVEGNPALLIRVDNPRFIYRQGRYSVSIFVIAFALLALVLGGGIQWLNQKLNLSERLKRASEERHRAIVEQAAEGILLAEIETGAIIEANAALVQLCGYSMEELFALTLEKLFPSPEEAAIFTEAVHEESCSATCESRLRRSDGAMIAVEIHVSRIIYDGTPILCVIVENITERKRSQEALRQSEERYALVSRAANDGLWDWDLATEKVYYSSRWKSMLGYEDHEIGENLDAWLSRVHPNDAKQLQAKIHTHLQQADSHFEQEYRMLHKNGDYRWMLTRGLAVKDESGIICRMAGSQSDITLRKQVEDQLRHDALHDGLTGLANRELFMDRLERAILRSKQHETYRFAVLFLDLDRFKVVNDGLGHDFGDRMLIQVAEKLQRCLGPDDTLARWGGDEFTLLMEYIESEGDAIRLANKIHESLRTPMEITGIEVTTSTSIGIALSSPDYDRADDLLRDADTTMYRAKAEGRGSHAIFDTAMRSRAKLLVETESDLRRAIEREEFEILYQPIVNAEDGHLLGSEALVYWQHPLRGLLSPGLFIPIAEETGLIELLGEWVMKTACVQNVTWQREWGCPDLKIAVNVSARQFQQNLPELVRKCLSETEMPAHTLAVEVTESTAMRDIDLSVRVLNELSEMGVSVSIDDFGTGYSSLGYLKRFPINKIKIDRSFVKDIEDSIDDAAISQMIIAMAHSLNMKVVAEGVETSGQLDFLRAHECDEIQGFFFSRPVTRDQFAKKLEGNVLNTSSKSYREHAAAV
jgi:diguanylate cyclase (GGDEF)-like protein/PAS domain S-box-containing protein